MHDYGHLRHETGKTAFRQCALCSKTAEWFHHALLRLDSRYRGYPAMIGSTHSYSQPTSVSPLPGPGFAGASRSPVPGSCFPPPEKMWNRLYITDFRYNTNYRRFFCLMLS